MLRFLGSGDIKAAVHDYFRQRNDLSGQVVVDIPAGRGVNSAVVLAQGARVEAFDLFPRFFEARGLSCSRADLRGPLPIASEHADLVLFQEAIEHLSDQLGVLVELNRILKPGGTLILTTPNVSHLRARLSHFLLESELYNRLPANESDALWFSDGESVYLGHLFLIGAQRLRVLARLAGFRIVRFHPVKVSVTSLLLGISYPLLLAFNAFAYVRGMRRRGDGERDVQRRTLREVLRLNLHPTVLFGKHLFVELAKESEAERAQPRVLKDADTIC
jgi:SAM-dependent methyltransferase